MKKIFTVTTTSQERDNDYPRLRITTTQAPITNGRQRQSPTIFQATSNKIYETTPSVKSSFGVKSK